MKLLFSPLRRAAYLIWSRIIGAPLRGGDAFELLGLDLVIAPGVLHPRHFASSRMLARHVMSLELEGTTVMDIGTGSGLLGLVAARAGARVLAADINPEAVRCARENALRNGLESRFEAYESDIFDGIGPALRFDVVVTNPPFYPRSPRDAADLAFAAGVDHAFFSKLALQLPDRLHEGGRAVLVQSSDTDFAPIARIFDAAGLRGETVGVRRGFFETLTIREFRRNAA
jgi:release factor glutamine methyltransferase